MRVSKFVNFELASELELELASEVEYRDYADSESTRTSAELGVWVQVWDWIQSSFSLAHWHSSSHALPFFSPPTFHTLAFSPEFTSVWWSA